MVCLFQCIVSIIYKHMNQSQIVHCSKILCGLVVSLQPLFVLHLSSLLSQPLDLFSEYCLEHGIPFPSTELSQEDQEHLKECYVFEDSLEAPILAYFPLVCDTFQKYKAPSKLTALIVFWDCLIQFIRWICSSSKKRHWQASELAKLLYSQSCSDAYSIGQLIRDWNEEV